MSHSLVAFVGVYLLCFVGAIFFAPLGIWGFIFESNFHPPYQWWGGPLVAVGERWSFYIGAMMVFSVAIHWSRFSDTKVFSDRKLYVLVFFILNAMVVSVLWAHVQDKSWKESIDYLKWFLVYIAIVKTHSNRLWMPIVLYIYILSAIKMGWDQTWDPKLGRTFQLGTSTSYEINFLAAHIVTLMPIAAAIVFSHESNTKLRWVVALGFPFMFNLFVYASSRGAMLALAGTGIVALLITKGQLRKYVLISLVLGAILGAWLFNEDFISRFYSIQQYDEDASATGRIHAWKAAWTIFGDHPLGVGAEGFDSGLGAKHMPLGFHTTHNTFFEILVAWGVLGIVTFYGSIFWSMFECLRVKRANWVDGQTRQNRAVWESTAVILAFVGILGASMFLNRVRYEMWWVLMAYSTCLKNTYLPGLNGEETNDELDDEDEEFDSGTLQTENA